MSAYGWFTRNNQSTDDAAIETDIASISAKLTGYVYSVEVSDNQQVKKNDILVRIDQRDFQYAIEVAQAEYNIALENLTSSYKSFETTRITAPSEADAAQSQVDAARSKWNKAVTDLNRVRKLDDIVLSKQQLDDAITNEQTTRSDLEDKISQLKSAQTAPNAIAIAQSKVRELQASVEKARANLSLAELNLQNTIIIAPFDGKIIKKNLAVGNLVQPGQKLLALVSNDFWVVANFKETQIKKMRPGQKVKIKIDAFPDLSLSGKVDSIQSGTGAKLSLFPPENATGNYVKVVQRIPVKIVLDSKPPNDLAIAPGMSVEPTVYTK